jgi:hypothetical protein
VVVVRRRIRVREGRVVEGRNEHGLLSEEGGEESEEEEGGALREEEGTMKTGELCGGRRDVVLGKKHLDLKEKMVGWM